MDFILIFGGALLAIVLLCDALGWHLVMASGRRPCLRDGTPNYPLLYWPFVLLARWYRNRKNTT